jgi:hypothetical protein
VSTDPTRVPTRRLAVATYSGLAVIGLIAIALVNGASPAPAPGSALTARLTAVRSGSASRGEPPFATKAESRRLARRLLGNAVLPPGSRVYRGKLPSGLHSGQLMSATSSADVHQLFVETMSMKRTDAFFKRHHPAGWKQVGSGSGWRTAAGNESPTIEMVNYSPVHLPAADFDISMNVGIVSADGHALTRIDVQVVYYPRRSRAERLIPGDLKAVTIAAQYYEPRYHTVKRTFTQRAIISRLARTFNARPASPGGVVSCPAIFEQFELRFAPVKGQPATTVGVVGCSSYSVVVAGHSEPALADNGSAEKVVERLMPPEAGPGLATTAPPAHPAH